MDSTEPGDEAGPATPNTADRQPADTLSPTVRRLVRQYDLDIASIQGTGPAGRIRVGDVIGMLGGRAAEPPPRGAATARVPTLDSADLGLEGTEEPPAEAPSHEPAHAIAAAPADAGAPAIMSTVFECDLSRVLAHRKRERNNRVHRLVTSYFLVACAEASRTTAELTDGRVARFGVELTAAEGTSHSLFVDTEDTRGSLDERLRTIDERLRAGANGDFAQANMLVHYYGASGSLIVTPTPVGAGHAGSIGIGRVRREIIVRTAENGEDEPRVIARCYMSLSFLPERIALNRANQFLAHTVRILEQWPA